MALEPWEWLVIGLIVAGVVIVFVVIFWEGVIKTIRKMPAQQTILKDQGPLPKADYTKVIWAGETVGHPPAKRSINLTYTQPERVVMSFFADFTDSRGVYLDPVRAIRVNGEIVEIRDMPSDPEKLRSVKKDNVDITQYIQTSDKGIINNFEVSYIVKGRGAFLRSSLGKMTMVISVMMPRANIQGVGRETKFCMNCDTTIPVKAPFCWNCGVPQEAFSGLTTRKCLTCGTELPMVAIYCYSCGTAQPQGAPESIPAQPPSA
ncbi:MAG: zinc ribbon domain-containing protein [Nitrososphaerota archaeon]|nr:zinc ribbon domain-containing protein [Nitrososphaerota archaeon]